MAIVTMRQLLEARVHFGHQTRRWNPKMRRFIFGERNDIYIIDLQQTLERIETAYAFVRDLVAGGGSVLFMGGMLTNFETIHKRVQKMLELERLQETGDFALMPKKEALLKSRELAKLQKNLSGIRHMTKRPQCVFIIDTKKEHIGVTEANKLGIPIVGIVDTNVDPDLITFPIPGNDDAIRANELMSKMIAEAVIEGRYIASKRNPGLVAPEKSDAEKAEFAANQANARTQAAAAQAEREARLAATKAPVAEAAADTTSDSSPEA
jgi:small subunit ribosomal protein S2